MVCCAWNLNIFNNETSFYEAKKQQKCHDILRMSHCILWCHFHCIWWINKWWKTMLMRFVDMAFIPRHSLSLCVCVCEQNNKQTWTASVNRTAEGKKINNNINETEGAPCDAHRCSTGNRKAFVQSVAITFVTVNTDPRLKSETVIQLLSCKTALVPAYTSESVKSKTPRELQLATRSSIKVWQCPSYSSSWLVYHMFKLSLISQLWRSGIISVMVLKYWLQHFYFFFFIQCAPIVLSGELHLNYHFATSKLSSVNWSITSQPLQ